MGQPAERIDADDLYITTKITIKAIGPKHLRSQIELISKWVGKQRC